MIEKPLDLLTICLVVAFSFNYYRNVTDVTVIKKGWMSTNWKAGESIRCPCVKVSSVALDVNVR